MTEKLRETLNYLDNQIVQGAREGDYGPNRAYYTMLVEMRLNLTRAAYYEMLLIKEDNDAVENKTQ